MAEVHEGADIIDSRDVIARISELEDERDFHEEGRKEAMEGGLDEADALPWAEEEPDDAEELETLKKLAAEGEGCSDWSHGEGLIADHYFETYAQELAEDIGAMPDTSAWPGRCIDWEQAARELQMDYTSVEYGSTTYWIRS